MDATHGKHAASERRRHPLLAMCTSVVVGVAVYFASVLLEQRGINPRFELAVTVAKVGTVVVPIPIVVWQAMSISRRLRGLTAIVAVLAIFWLGHWLQGLFGLDPPYIYFVLGMSLQIEAVAIAVAVVVAFTASSISRTMRGR